MKFPNVIGVQIKRLTETAILPTYGSDEAAGFDLHADIPHQLIIGPGEQATISTGIGMALPRTLALFICPRSGLSSKMKVTVHNGPGVIDADYRGGIGVILHNTGYQQFVVKPDDRVAQGVIVPIFRARWTEVEDLGETDRGTGGFGSTGVEQRPVSRDTFNEAVIRTPSIKMPYPDPVYRLETFKAARWTELTGQEVACQTVEAMMAVYADGRRLITVGGRDIALTDFDLSPAAQLAQQALMQDARDRSPRPAPGSSETQTKDRGHPVKWLEAMPDEGEEPEEAASRLGRITSAGGTVAIDLDRNAIHLLPDTRH